MALSGNCSGSCSDSCFGNCSTGLYWARCRKRADARILSTIGDAIILGMGVLLVPLTFL